MNEFLEKWHNDKKYQAKIKLMLYGIFIIIVSLFAILQRDNVKILPMDNDKGDKTIYDGFIDIPDKYSYIINIIINDKEYTFNGTKNENDETIIKTSDNTVENFIIKDKQYYKDINGNYYKTIQSSVYEPIDYDYINLENINLYLANARRNNKEYIIYLKDIMLDSTSDEYFTINIDNNYINIDYTPLIKQINPGIYKYIVNIEIIKE